MKKILKLLFVFIFALFISKTNVNANYRYYEDPTITIKNAYCAPSEGYLLYLMIDYDRDSEGIVKVNPIRWARFFESGYGSNFVTLTEDGTVTEIKEITDTKKFIEEALKVTEDGASFDDKIDTGSCTEIDGVNTLSKVVRPGYYLVKSPKGTKAALVNVDPEGIIEEKNNFDPEVSFYINKNGTLKKLASAAAGSEVNYVINVKLREGLKGFKLEFNETLDSTFKSLTIEGLKEGSYIINDKTIIIKQEFLDSIADSVEFKINANTELWRTAYIDPNYFVKHYLASVKYDTSENPNSWNDDTTTLETVKLYTWNYTIRDYAVLEDSSGGKGYVALPNVHYVLSRTNNVSNPDKIAFIKTIDGSYRLFDEWYDLDESKITELIGSRDNGEIKLQGLDAGTYYLIQTGISEGYEKNDAVYEIKINPVEEDDELVLKNNLLEIFHNREQVSLPSTGENGTTLLVTIGITLFIVSLGIIITNLRRENN